MNYTVAVRALAEFTAKAGDLDLRFTPAPTAQQGIAGHQLVTSRRGDDYRTELSLSGEYRQLQVRGRADGYDPGRNRLEEIKTFRGDLASQPANHRALHWAQAKLYGWLLCQQEGLAQLDVALVYFDIVSQRETVFCESFAARQLRDFFEHHCEAFLGWAEQEAAHRVERDAALQTLSFPHAEFRTGQRALAEGVYKAACTGAPLLAQAPTGIGKTLGTLFPLLKAMPGQALDKVFFLAAKTPGRALALQALDTLRTGALPLRVIELIARDKACEHPDKACHGESCPLARGFYDRLGAARAAALATPRLDRAALQAVAAAHGVCPYYLGQELARWCDVAVGDYNYYFDLSALLHGLTAANQWRVGVLVDEAHNLVERGRSMYTAALDHDDLRALRRTAPAALKKPLDRLHRQWNALAKAQQAPYQVYPAPPPAWLAALQETVAAITDYLTDQPAALETTLQQFYFGAMLFCRVADLFDDHFLFDISQRPGAFRRPSTTLCLRNVVPGPLLAPRFEAAQAVTLFSATLGPAEFYRNLLGLPAHTRWLEVPSPFKAEQLAVRIVDTISTRFSQRAASIEPIAAAMAAQFARRPGNYLAFFSSFDYLQQVAARFAQRHPDIPHWQQARRMDEGERAAFLDRFAPAGCGIGFAVLGGAFGEGIDLPGDRLIGAFIATLGLPQVNPVNEQMKQRLDALFGAGYDYAYFFPGLQKVVQAAGRVIRTPEDNGTVLLIDDRFGQPRVQRLLPGWWQLAQCEDS